MMMLFRSVLTIAVICAIPLHAADLQKIPVAANYKTKIGETTTVEIRPGGIGIKWTLENPDKTSVNVYNLFDDRLVFDRLYDENPAMMVFRINVDPAIVKAGETYPVGMLVAKDNRAVEIGRIIIRIAGAPVPPVPPTPPDPPVPPVPPQPPAPIPVDGFRVLVVYEKDSVTPAFANVLNDPTVRAYLQKKCVAGPDGKTAECRFFDQHTPMQNESKLWQDAMARPRKSLPWLVVSNGKTGAEVPIPTTITVTDFLNILKLYGGE